MSDQFDLFGEPEAPAAVAAPDSAPKKPEPSAPKAERGRCPTCGAFMVPSNCQEYVCPECGYVGPPAPVHPRTCGECANIKPTKFRRQEGVSFFCAESYADARREDPSCGNRFEPRIGPCEGCGPICDVFITCPNADPKGPEEIAPKGAKE